MTCHVCGNETRRGCKTRLTDAGVWRDDVICPDCECILARMDEDGCLNERWSFQR